MTLGPEDPSRLFLLIRPGDTIEVTNPGRGGGQVRCRATIVNFIRDPRNLTVACARKNGHPLVCTPENFIRIVV